MTASELRLSKILHHLQLQPRNKADTVTLPSMCNSTEKLYPTIEDIYDGISPMVGKDLGVSRWMKLTQKELDTFSDLTNDHNYIHKLDAKKNGSPFGAPIAHGLLTLSMLPTLVTSVMSHSNYYKVFKLEYLKSGVNYGFNNVRFISPVFVNSEIRVRVVLKSAEIAKGKRRKLKAIRYERELVIETKNPKSGKVTDALVCVWVTMNIFK